MTTLEKIRAEIQKVLDKERDFTSESAKAQAIALMWCLDIIDRYAEQEPCDDAISRQAAINIASLHCLTIDESVKALEQLPSVRPQEQTKEEHLDVFEVANAPWIFLDNCANSGYYCSKCKKKLVKEGWSETVKKINFCPNCGARMFEPQESEE